MTGPSITRAAVAATIAGVLAVPATAQAHGITQRADLPIPEWLFAWGAAAVLIASFAGLSVLWQQPVLAAAAAGGRRLRIPAARLLEVLGGVAGIALFALAVYAGFAGNQAATANITPTLVYVVLWVGVPVASAVVGDVFAWISPWRAVARAVGWGAARIARADLPQPLAYPERLGRWPAAAGILAFAWFELVFINRDHPDLLAGLAVGYAATMLVGMSVFGIETWSRRADPLAVYFGLFARLAPLRWRDRELQVRMPLSGATTLVPIAGTTALLCVGIGTTSFDGFQQGALWSGESGVGGRLTRVFADLGLGPEAAVQVGTTVGLLAVVGIVSAVVVLGLRRASRVTGSDRSTPPGSYVHSLIPIALAYLVAHYFSLLLFQGQAIGFLVSDPLGRGDDLFGTAVWSIDYGVISAAGIWYVQVAALVLGHVAGLALAHDRALELWPDRRLAVRSQYWMLLVMITLTCLGLWLLSAASR